MGKDDSNSIDWWRLRFCGFEAEAGVVGGPFTVGVAELGAEGFLDFGEVGVAFGRREFIGEIVAEGLEPGGDVAG